MTTKSGQGQRLTVYEIINESRKEIFVGATSQPIFSLVGEISRRRPSAIRHWDLSEATSVRSVEFDLTAAGAKDFITTYVQSTLPQGWRFLQED